MAVKNECRVKWFNRQKEFGFFTLPDGKDVFVHRQQLDADGISLKAMAEQAKAEIVHEEHLGRLRTTKVLWVGEDPTQMKERVVRRKKTKTKPDSLQVGDRLWVQIKFYNSDRGFGFAKPIGKGKEHPDLFFHISMVPDELQEELDPGTVFAAAVGENDQGLTAVILPRDEETVAAE